MNLKPDEKKMLEDIWARWHVPQIEATPAKISQAAFDIGYLCGLVLRSEDRTPPKS